jgi:hypothetical protein
LRDVSPSTVSHVAGSPASYRQGGPLCIFTRNANPTGIHL